MVREGGRGGRTLLRLDLSGFARESGDATARRIAERSRRIREYGRLHPVRAALPCDQRRAAGPVQPRHLARRGLDDQAELDRYWNALLAGGKAEQCGWLKDKYGLSWQIVPARLGEMMEDSDPAKARRVAQAILKMVKLDIAGLEAAFAGRSA